MNTIIQARTQMPHVAWCHSHHTMLEGADFSDLIVEIIGHIRPWLEEWLPDFPQKEYQRIRPILIYPQLLQRPRPSAKCRTN